MNIHEENQIIADIINGNSTRFGVLVQEYQRPIASMLLRMTGSKDDAADLTQETFVRAYERLYKFKPGSRFFPWVYTIGMNIGRDYLRRNGRTPTNGPSYLDEMGDPTQLSQSNEHVDTAIAVNQGLEQLEPEQREALILRFHQGFSFKEIGESLGLTLSGAQMRVYRGLEKMKSILTEKQ